MRDRVGIALGLALAVSSLGGCSGGGPGAGPGGGPGLTAGTRPEQARVLRVVDGDTVDVRLGGGARARVRLLGIDTPEVYNGLECGGRAASRAAERLLPPGTRVVLVPDQTQALVDRYGRILRYVMRGDLDIDRVLVARGHATVYVYDDEPFQRAKDYFAAQAAAQAQHRGLWKHCR